MIDRSNIESADWLIKGLSKEELQAEKIDALCAHIKLLEDNAVIKKNKSQIDGRYAKGSKVYMDRVFIRPVEHHYEDIGEPEYIKYGCPICESFGARHSFAHGAKNCPICNVNLLWDDSDVLMQYEEEIYED